LLGRAAPAAAQDVAEALFKHGVAEMEAGRHETACPAIAESRRLDPRPGTLFTLAECEAGWGKTATALAHYEEYLALLAQMTAEQQDAQRLKGREKRALEQCASLTAEAPTLTLELAAGAPHDTRVKRDGAELAASALGIAVPVDPGEHVVTAQAPGGPVSELHVRLARGEKKRLALPVPEAKPEVPQVAAEPSRSSAAAPQVRTAPSKRRVGAYVAGGIGITAAALGGVMAAATVAERSIVNTDCHDTAPGHAVCTPEGKTAASRAQAFGLVSTIGVGVGLGGLTTAMIVLLTEPPARPDVPRQVSAGVLMVGTSVGVFGVRGTW
jgi:hypothetical protein